MQGDLLPTLMFGSNIWGGYGLNKHEMSHKLQGPYSLFMRRILGVPESCGHWIASVLLGQLPVQYHIIRHFCRFWNRLLLTAQLNPLVQACVQAQVALLRSRRSSWLSHWCTRLKAVTPSAVSTHILQAVRDTNATDARWVQRQLVQSYRRTLTECGDPFAAQCAHRRTALAFRVFHGCGKLGHKPTWHHLDWASLPTTTWVTWNRYVSTFAALPVHVYAHAHLDFADRRCTKCHTGEAGDEAHVVLRCGATAGVRAQYQDKLWWPHAQVHGLPVFISRNSLTPDLPVCIAAILDAFTTAPTVA
jgi:hypothetical protein